MTSPERSPGRRGLCIQFEFDPNVYAALADHVVAAGSVFQQELRTDGIRHIRGYRGLSPEETQRVERYVTQLRLLPTLMREIGRGMRFTAVSAWYPETDSPYSMIDRLSVTSRPKDNPVPTTRSKPQMQLHQEIYMGEMEIGPDEIHMAGLTRSPEQALDFIAYDGPFLNLSICDVWKDSAHPSGLMRDKPGAGISFIFSQQEGVAYPFGLVHVGYKPVWTGRLKDKSHKMSRELFLEGVSQVREAAADYYRRKSLTNLTHLLKEPGE